MGKALRLQIGTEVVVVSSDRNRHPAAGDGHVVGGFEVATIRGTTTRAPSFDHPRHKVSQVGAAATAGYETGNAGAWLDFVFASGDQNPFDENQNAFNANR